MDMYQSPFFISECKKRMSSISDWGFRLVQEDSREDWAILRWELEGIRVSIEYHPYAHSLNTYIDYRGYEVNLRKLYELAGINERPTYQFGSTNLEKGIEAVTKRIMTFLDGYDLYDHSKLMSDISSNFVKQKSDETRFLN
ncbi:MAG: hypothetical protein K6G47_03880 [Clostridia bacterium]|nr:hypothetical protein [Clostridiales bacterium]MCR5803382.1 hypothetical protein [Clostridia bacterium]